jgi:hypothetical protein
MAMRPSSEHLLGLDQRPASRKGDVGGNAVSRQSSDNDRVASAMVRGRRMSTTSGAESPTNPSPNQPTADPEIKPVFMGKT